MRTWWLASLLLTACSFDPDARPSAPSPEMGTADVGDAGDEGDPVAADATRDVDPVDDATVVPDAAADVATDVGADAEAPLDMSMPEAGVSLVGGRLVLFTDEPANVSDCAAPDDCTDADGDGLVDAWEALVLDVFRPWVVLDEDDDFLDDPDAVLLHVGRVTPDGRRPAVDRVLVYLTILWDRDYGSCGSLTSHNGDSERVVLRLSVSPGAYAVEAAHLAAHEGTLTDTSTTVMGMGLQELEFDISTPRAARWVVYPSRNKHGTYPTKQVCESTSPLPCFREECGPVFATDSSTARLLDVYNAGEPEAPLLEDLGPIGFPGEDAWADQSFCGGHNRSFTCPGSVAGKLTENPF